MSMPEFPKPNPDLTREQALTMILSSIALEEVALSHIMNAEGEKIQYILNQASSSNKASLNDILSVNKSVTDLLEMVLQNQMILKNKMEKVLEFIPKPPLVTEPPDTFINEDQCNCKVGYCNSKQSYCVDIVPKLYYYDENLQWKISSIYDKCKICPMDLSKIQMPRTGTFLVDINLEVNNLLSKFIDLKIALCCDDKRTIIKKVNLDRYGDKCFFKKRIFIEMPCSCSPCYVSVIINTSSGVAIKQGNIIFTKL